MHATRPLLPWLLSLLVLSGVRALYSPGGPVALLDAGSFASRLKKGPALVEFYAPWCGHCKALVPEWEKTAKALAGIVSVTAVDADSHKELGAQYGVQGFPTIKFMYHDGSKIKAVDYNGGRTAKDIVGFAMDKAKSLALKRIGAKASTGSGSGGNAGKASAFYSPASGVINLRESNFDAQVTRSDDVWFVEFFAPWCGHCKNLKPEYIKAAGELEGKVKVGAVNCDEEQSLCSKFGVQGFPTIKFFGKNKGRPRDYDGARDAAGLVAFGLEQWAKHAPPPEVLELVDGDVFARHCVGDNDTAPKQLCIIAFLPDILDTKASGRNAYLAVLRRVAEAFKDRPYSYLWAAGGAQQGLEGNMEVGGFGYPAVVAFSPKRNVYVPLKGALQLDQMRDWIGGIRSGVQSALDIRGPLAPAATTSPWDGQDGVLMDEEEFSLDELMNEEL